MYISTQNGCSPATFLIETESRNTSANSKQNMAVMWSDGPSPNSPSLRLGLPAPQPSRRHYAQSLMGPSFHDPRTHHVLESHPEQAAPLSRRDNERRHAIGSHSTLELRLYLAACNPSSSCRSWVLDHLCSNLSRSFHFCWVTEIRSLNLCVRFYLFLFCLYFSDRNEFQLLVPVCNLVIITTAILLLLLPQYSFLAVLEIFNHSDTCAVPSACTAVGLLILFKLYPSSPFFNSWWQKNVSYLHIHLFSNVLHRRRRVSPRRPMYLLIVGSHYCVMRFAYALHVRQQNLVPFPCLYVEPFKLVIEVIVNYCNTPPCHKINLFKRLFRGSRF